MGVEGERDSLANRKFKKKTIFLKCDYYFYCECSDSVFIYLLKSEHFDQDTAIFNNLPSNCRTTTYLKKNW